MYDYLASNKISDEDMVDKDPDTFMVEEIVTLARKLDNRRELYIKRPVFVADTKESELHIGSDYKCKSNKIILDTLIKIDSSKKSEKSVRSLILGDCSKQLKVMNDIPSSEIEKIEESGSKNRKKLIRLCKLYQQNKDIAITSESTGKNAEIEREYKLAEKCLTNKIRN
jgi:hypothetical protein